MCQVLKQKRILYKVENKLEKIIFNAYKKNKSHKIMPKVDVEREWFGNIEIFPIYIQFPMYLGISVLCIPPIPFKR